MCTYLKNMEGKKPKDLKNKSLQKIFDSIQKMFDRAFKRVNTFVDFKTDLVKGSSKRAGEELEQESTKKQKVDEDKDIAELQSLMKVIPDEEEVAIDVGRIIGIKSLLNAASITAAHIRVNAAQLCDDEKVKIDDELSNPGDGNLIEETKIAEIFRNETNIFQFETPLCEAFKEFNYLLKIDVDILTNDIPRFKTYNEYKDAWIYEWNKDVPWNDERVDEHELMGDDDDDIGYLEDYLIHKDPPYHVNEEEERSKERRCKLLGIPYVKPPTCKSEKFEVVKYSFRPAEEYVAIKEYEYDIWVQTEENISQVYQDIF
ncbi:hypothetical protein Tco_1370226 [Tanacetum coccineum]